MVSIKNIVTVFFALTLSLPLLTSCDTSEKPGPLGVTPDSKTESTVDVPADSESETDTSVSTPAPELTPAPTPAVVPPTSVYKPTPDFSKPDSNTTPDSSSLPKTPIVPKKNTTKPNDSPLLPEQGNVEPDGKGGILSPQPEVMPETPKITPKPKAESKTQQKAQQEAISTRKAVFAKAAKLVPGGMSPKFQEYYKKLDALVSKVENQKPLSQEAIDSVNQLNMEYPEEATKFNAAMQKVMPKKLKG